ncbi:substrate-binding and VWA domain-containing protein [Micromonospora sp. NPDC047670]|uniref:substrate-binding and VWA domain-containing protein n=1 Tax=Micromonospora sp. NPDC047670 TaxID=3364252 RepID=UPI003715601A
MLRDGPATVRHLFRRSPVVLLSAALALLLAGWATVAYVRSDRDVSECVERVRLRVAAAPVVTPALDRIVRASVGAQPCVSIAVQARESAAVAAEVADGADVADAWVPESTFWLRRARAAGAFEVPGQGTSVASTPVVLAVTEPVARRLGWPAKPLTWRSLIGPKARDVGVGLPDPAVDPAGVGAVLGVRGLAAGERDPAASVAAVLRRLADRTFVPGDGGTLPAGSGPPGKAGAVATSEQAVLGHNALAGDDKLVAAYPEVAVPSLDLPYVVLPGADGPVREAAADFLANLLTVEARDALSGYGFRTTAGFPPAMPRDGRLSAEVREPVPLPAEETVTEALTGWSGVQRSARILTVLDISGSMAARVPGSDETRLGATLKAAREGSGLLLDNSELGVWVFSTKVDGDRDYREILPVGPLRTQRQRLVERLADVRVKPKGGTGLYDTTLAAYRDARRHWTPGRINLVLVMTDGRNEDEDSIGRSRFLAELAESQDPRRPLPIVFIGLGKDIDADELRSIAEITGGRVFRTDQPSGIRQIFFSALADLSCLPPECRR